jgi:hypothetical protein
MKRKQVHTTAEFDLLFLRDIKHRIKMLLRDVEKAERIVTKADKFERQAKATPQQVEAAMNFYRTLHENGGAA